MPNGESATFSLSLTITTTPQITMRAPRALYAGMFGNTGGGDYRGLGPLSCVLMLLSLATAAVGGSRRWVRIALIILMLAAVSQVGCDNGSISSSGSSVYESTQTAMSVGATADTPTGGPIGVGGLPAFMSQIMVPP